MTEGLCLWRLFCFDALFIQHFWNWILVVGTVNWTKLDRVQKFGANYFIFPILVKLLRAAFKLVTRTLLAAKMRRQISPGQIIREQWGAKRPSAEGNKMTTVDKTSSIVFVLFFYFIFWAISQLEPFLFHTTLHFNALPSEIPWLYVEFTHSVWLKEMCLKTVSFSVIGKTTDCAARLSRMEEQVLQPEEGIKTIKQRKKK